MGWRIRISRSRPPVDVEAVLASAPFASRDADVEELIRSAKDATLAGRATEAGALLDADVVAIVSWTRGGGLRSLFQPPPAPDGNGKPAPATGRLEPKELGVHLFDGSGRYIGIVLAGSRAKTLDFVDRAGIAFSMTFWAATPTTVFSGSTSAQITMGQTGEIIGTYDQKGRGRVFGADGELLGAVEVSKADQHICLLSSSGHELAHFRLLSRRGRTKRRRYQFVSIVEFDRAASPQIRALTLAGELCQEIQAQNDDSIG